MLLSEICNLPSSEGHNHSADKEIKETKDLFTMSQDPITGS